jgi:hypothetical protein
MKKVILSTLAALTLSTTAAVASEPVNVFAHADKLKFSALAYVGYSYNDFDAKMADGTPNTREDTSQFEIRRAYLQVKGYFMENPKSYYRVTLDVHQDNKATGGSTDGDNILRLKYAYMYLDNILPYTGVEVGIAHRPWHDYEEHNSWYFRSISKVLIEDKNAADLSNSADFGAMFKTKTKYFDMDAGIFNGEGYHAIQNKKGMSLEWRATAHILGVSGKDKQNEKTYWDASFFGQYNQKHKTADVGIPGTPILEDQDLVFGGLHTVYNQPAFLLSAQYVISQDTSDTINVVSKQAGQGYSANGEFRFGSDYQYRVLARYDSWTPEALTSATEYERKNMIGGFAWDQQKNVMWVANVEKTDNDARSSRESYNGIAYMLTAEISF